MLRGAAELPPLMFRFCRKQISVSGMEIAGKLPSAPADMPPAPEGLQSLSECLCEIKIHHLFLQFLSNNLRLRKSLLGSQQCLRNYHPCLQLWEKWSREVKHLVWGTSRIGHRSVLHALHSAGHETVSAHTSCETLQILLETPELSSHGFILAFNAVAQQAQVCELVITCVNWVWTLFVFCWISSDWPMRRAKRLLKLTDRSNHRTPGCKGPKVSSGLMFHGKSRF